MIAPDIELLPYERLLRACAATQVEEGASRTISALLSAPDLHWSAVVMQSIRHGLAQCVALQLRAFEEDPRVPADVAACFARMYRANALRNQVIFREVGRLLRALEASGIRCLVLKGIALSLTIYPDHALRNFADIDLLVDPKDYAAAKEVVEANGFWKDAIEPHSAQHHTTYFTACPEDILTETLAPEFDPIVTPEILERHRHLVVLELHQGIFRNAAGNLRRLDMAAFWEAPQTVALPDGTLMCLPSPEAMLVHLAAHASSHIFRRLLFPLDVSLAIRSYGPRLDWDRVVELADRFVAQEDVYRMLEFVRREFDAEVPAEALERLRPAKRQSRIPQDLQLVDIFQAMQTDPSAQTWRLLLHAKNTREFCVSLWHVLFPPRSTMLRIYGRRPHAVIALFYLIRPFQLAGRLGRVFYWQAFPQSRNLPPKGERISLAPLPPERS